MNYKLKRYHTYHVRHKKYFGLAAQEVKFGYDLYDPVQWRNVAIWFYIMEGF